MQKKLRALVIMLTTVLEQKEKHQIVIHIKHSTRSSNVFGKREKKNFEMPNKQSMPEIENRRNLSSRKTAIRRDENTCLVDWSFVLE